MSVEHFLPARGRQAGLRQDVRTLGVLPHMSAKAAILALCLATPALGADVWECFPLFEGLYGESVRAVVAENSSSIYMTDQVNDTWYRVEGIRRVWRWGLGELDDDPSSFRYAFVIKNGTDGAFFDFIQADDEGKAAADALYSCSR